jgi:hypothetical protein
VVELAPGVWAFAAGGGAGVVFQPYRESLRLGEEPGCVAEVEGDGPAAEDCGEDRGVAGEPAGFSGREGLVGVKVGCFEGALQDGVVDRDDHRGRAFRVQVVRREVLEELGEREPPAVPPVERTLRSCWLAHPARCGHGVQDLGQDRSGECGDGEVPGGGAIAVVVQRQ